MWERVNSLPNNKTIDWSKLKATADDKQDVFVKQECPPQQLFILKTVTLIFDLDLER